MEKIEIDEWINQLYRDEEGIFEIEYGGLKCKFTKRYPPALADKLKELKRNDNITGTMISAISIEPKFSFNQAKMLPTELTDQVMKIISDEKEKQKKKIEKEGKEIKVNAESGE